MKTTKEETINQIVQCVSLLSQPLTEIDKSDGWNTEEQQRWITILGGLHDAIENPDLLKVKYAGFAPVRFLDMQGISTGTLHNRIAALGPLVSRLCSTAGIRSR